MFPVIAISTIWIEVSITSSIIIAICVFLFKIKRRKKHDSDGNSFQMHITSTILRR